MLILNNVSKRFEKKVAVDSFSIKLESGMVGLLGPNGAGKTSLMRMLSTLIEPTSGDITYSGIQWNNRNYNEIRKLLGYLPQKFSLYKNIELIEALMHLALLKGVTKDQLKREVFDVIEKVNLQDHINKKIGKLSGGMIRRLGIAQALLGDPKIIIIDEPTSGLDPDERIRFRGLLKSFSQKSLVLVSTHIVEDIESTCDHVAIMNNGRLLVQGTTSDIANYAEGKVWGKQVTKEDFFKEGEKLNIISSQRVDDSFNIRMLSELPVSGAIMLKPTLEDGYLSLIRKENV